MNLLGGKEELVFCFKDNFCFVLALRNYWWDQETRNPLIVSELKESETIILEILSKYRKIIINIFFQ